MPIPSFGAEGLLPPGLHGATLEEVLERFGQASAQRRLISDSLRWAVAAARKAGIKRFILDGSFIDAKRNPKDADCALLFGEGDPPEPAAVRELEDGFPYLQLILFEADEIEEFEEFLGRVYTTDR